MFVVARAVYAMYLAHKGVQPAIVGSLEANPSEMVQTALFWSEKLRNLSGILLVITALCECLCEHAGKDCWLISAHTPLPAKPTTVTTDSLPSNVGPTTLQVASGKYQRTAATVLLSLH
jgi:hypothetical protein